MMAVVTIMRTVALITRRWNTIVDLFPEVGY